MTNNRILLERKNKLIIPVQNNQLNESILATILTNFDSVGFSLSQDAYKALSQLNKETAIELYSEVIEILNDIKGSNVNHQILYSNFPHVCMDKDDALVFLYNFVHVLTQGAYNIEPTEKVEATPLIGNYKNITLTTGSENDVFDICKNLIASKTSTSEDDKNVFRFVLTNNPQSLDKILPSSIPHKENLSFVSGLIYQLYPVKSETTLATQLSKVLKTATDILRFAGALSGWTDTSLSEKLNFKSFSRSERRLIMSLLEKAGNIEEDMLRHKETWKRLSSNIHPFEYKKQCPNTTKQFKNFMEGKVETFGGKVEKAFIDKNENELLALLSSRPGDFARKLDRALRTFDCSPNVVKSFENISKDVSTTVLLQLMNHFKNRNTPKELRVFFPKGSTTRAYGIQNNLENLSEDVVESICSICESALISKYSELPHLGKIFIDEELKDYLVPFAQRSASKGAKTIVTGSKFPITYDKDFLRAFIHWKDTNNESIDLDLSMVLYDENWDYLDHISYTATGNKKLSLHHSGDVRFAPNGATEYIDIDIPKLWQTETRYIVFSVFSYTHQEFADIDECFFGWMEREERISGEKFDPRAVRHKANLSSKSKTVVPVIFDLLNDQFIWADIAMNTNYGERRGNNNVENGELTLALTCKNIVEMSKTNLYELFLLHAKARGILVDNKEDADLIYSVDEGITPFDIDVIMGQYL